MRILVLFSGGVESTSLLKHLLETTDHEINAVHVYAPNSVGRAEVEWQAVTALAPHLRKIRKFNLQRIDVTLPWDTRDAELHSALIPAAMKGTGSQIFLRGLCAEDFDTVAHDHGKRRLIARQVAGWLGNDRMWDQISPDMLHFWLKKHEHMEYLGDLLPLTWSCLTPVQDETPVPCGVCKSCQLRASYQPRGQHQNMLIEE